MGDLNANPISVEIMDIADVGVRRKYPLSGVTQQHAEEFHERNQLPIEKDVFVRGVLAIRHQEEIEGEFEDIARQRANDAREQGQDPEPWKHLIQLRIGTHVYTRIESELLCNAWTRTRKETFRGLSRLHKLLIVACIYAAMTQGWDQAAMAGAATLAMKGLRNPTLPPEFPDPAMPEPDYNHNEWLYGITVGVPFFTGAVLGLLMTDPVSGIMGFGRRGAICIAGIFSFISVIGSASVDTWEHLLGFRILLGAGMAGKASIVPVLLSETSPTNIRGMILVFWQLFVTFGLAAGSIANLSVYQLNPIASWRYMFIAAFIPALLLLSLILFSPESPRWLLKESGADKYRASDDPRRCALVREAFKSLIDLRGEPSPILAAGELFLIHTRLIDEQVRLQDALSHAKRPGAVQKKESIYGDPFGKVVDHVGWWPRVKLMFFISGPTRRAHIAAAAVMISQQLCGINLLAFLSDSFVRSSMFHQDQKHETNDTEQIQLLGISFGFMMLNFLATIPALFIIDRSNGRRRALNWSFPCMAISLLSSALLLKSPEKADGDLSTGTIVGHFIFLGMFVIAYSVGEGPAAFVVSAEVFPLVNRELGMSLAVFWNFTGAGLLAVLGPRLSTKLGKFGILILFAGLNIVAWFLCYWLVPSTGNEDLENVSKKLEVPLGFILRYLAKVMFWRVKRLAQFCYHLGSKDWEDCGDVPEPKTIVEEYEDYLERLENATDDTQSFNTIELRDM